MNASVGQILRPDLTLFQSEGDRALSQGWFGAASKPNPFGAVAVTLPHLDGGLWRSLAGNIVFVVRGFFGSGEPNQINRLAENSGGLSGAVFSVYAHSAHFERGVSWTATQ